MKQLRLLMNFYDRNVFASSLLLVIMTLSLFSVTNAVGKYRYLFYARDVLAGSKMESAVYFMPEYSPDQMNLQAVSEKVGTLSQKLTEFPAVKDTAVIRAGNIRFNGRDGNFQLCGQSMLNFKLNLAGGNWFPDDAPEGQINGIVGGNTLFRRVSPGDNITVSIFDKQGTESQLKVHIVGKLADPPLLPAFGSSAIGGTVMANNFLQPGDATILLQETPQLAGFLEGKSEMQVEPNFFVRFSGSASQSEIEKAEEFMKENGTFSAYEEIMTASDEEIKEDRNKQLVMPLFFLFVSTMALISVSTLMVRKKLGEHSIYYLCGCSRVKSFCYLLGGIGLISIVACLINILVIAFHPVLEAIGVLHISNAILDSTSILILVIYLVVVVLISAILPFLIFFRESPIELYRRRES